MEGTRWVSFPDPREGYLFIKWFFDNKALEFVHISPGSVPMSTAALEDEEIRNDPYLGFGSVLEDPQDNGLRNFHVFPGRLDVRSQEPTIAESVMLDQAIPQEAVEPFLQHAQEVFELYADDPNEFREEHEIVW